MDLLFAAILGFAGGFILQCIAAAHIYRSLQAGVFKVVDEYHRELAAAHREIESLKKLV